MDYINTVLPALKAYRKAMSGSPRQMKSAPFELQRRLGLDMRKSKHERKLDEVSLIIEALNQGKLYQGELENLGALPLKDYEDQPDEDSETFSIGDMAYCKVEDICGPVSCIDYDGTINLEGCLFDFDAKDLTHEPFYKNDKGEAIRVGDHVHTIMGDMPELVVHSFGAYTHGNIETRVANVVPVGDGATCFKIPVIALSHALNPFRVNVQPIINVGIIGDDGEPIYPGDEVYSGPGMQLSVRKDPCKSCSKAYSKKFDFDSGCSEFVPKSQSYEALRTSFERMADRDDGTSTHGSGVMRHDK